MSALETSNMEDLHARFSELYDQEREICREMAQFIIANSDGEAANIRDFYRAMFGLHGSEKKHEKFEELAAKVESQTRAGDIVLIDRTSQDKSAKVGILAPGLVNLSTDKSYRLGVTETEGTDRKLLGYEGAISIPLLPIDKPTTIISSIYRYGRPAWEDLARVTAYAHHNFSTRIWEFVEADQVHFGFENVLMAASSLGDLALRKVAFFHEQAEQLANI